MEFVYLLDNVLKKFFCFSLISLISTQLLQAQELNKISDFINLESTVRSQILSEEVDASDKKTLCYSVGQIAEVINLISNAKFSNVSGSNKAKRNLRRLKKFTEDQKFYCNDNIKGWYFPYLFNVESFQFNNHFRRYQKNYLSWLEQQNDQWKNSSINMSLENQYKYLLQNIASLPHYKDLQNGSDVPVRWKPHTCRLLGVVDVTTKYFLSSIKKINSSNYAENVFFKEALKSNKQLADKVCAGWNGVESYETEVNSLKINLRALSRQLNLNTSDH